ncbi:MAG: hypothetical protein ACI87E_003802 [Mariniblastus sp.]|jgi:hypothetical protein
MKTVNTHLRYLLVILAILICPMTANANENSRVAASEKAANRSTVSSVPHAEIKAISDQIDALVKAKLSADGQQLNERSSDEVFLRRSYLDITGRIPGIQETKTFLGSKSESKREDLIDDLLDSYGFVSRQYNFYADLLRIKSRLPGQLTGISYIDYVKDSLEDNKPYDEFVRDLVASNGANLERGNGSVGYYLRDRNMPEDNMSNTIRVFLGTRLECAQCHDHPFDKWTQRQYFEMVAFTGGIRYRAPNISSSYQEMRALVRKGEIPERQRQIANRLSQGLGHGVAGSGTGLARLPEGFLGEEGYEGEIVVGKTMFEGMPLVDAKIPKVSKRRSPKAKANVQQAAIPGAKPIGARDAYAKWLTSHDNPRFAKVIANRLWKQALGLGLIEPVDIIEDSTIASNPELMEFLTETMLELKFDTKQFLRAIYNSETYQACAFDTDINDPTKFGFNGPVVRRMSSEQIWDSLLVLTVPDIDQRSAPPAGQYAASGSSDPYELFERIRGMKIDEFKTLLEKMATKGRGKKVSSKDNPEYKKLVAERATLNKKIQQAKKRNNTDLERKLRIDQAKLVAEFRRKTNARSFLRASEMDSPAPAGHFLREFGQSDRESIENASTDPAVTQVLSMMNGYVEEKIARDPSSVLMQTALAAKSAKECTESIFLSMLNRKPSRQESRSWDQEFKDASKAKDLTKVREIYADLIWTLANSNEFIFVK